MAYSTSDDIGKLLSDVASRKEFITTGAVPTLAASSMQGFIPGPGKLILPGVRLNGAQLFITNWASPNSQNSRLLIKWQTGVGKSIAAISISVEFIKRFRMRAQLGITSPTVFVISFVSKDTFQEDMLRFPEFGIVSQAEAIELQRLRSSARTAADAKYLSSHTGVLRRRMTDRSRGGYFRFFGYKEFSNHLFLITKKGEAADFSIQELYARDKENFETNLHRAIGDNLVRLNKYLLDSMRDGLLICDEIHNAYNITEPNNYGIAIQFALDTLGIRAPRAVFMSATPITGSAAEVADLLNLLTVRVGPPIKRSDLFTKKSNGRLVLKAGALKRISQLTAGKVSYLLDSDITAYPRRIFVGESLPEIPYLKITACPMSKLHQLTLDARGDDTLAANAYTLHDMVFPNPDDSSSGLYLSIETPLTLRRADADWLLENDISINKDNVISGNFLHADNLPKYSTKYAAILKATIDAIQAGPGKIMIYHHRVVMSGVLLLQEMMHVNGIIKLNAVPTANTRCSTCGNIMHKHTSDHTFRPARFIVAHGGQSLDRATMTGNISKFNAASNLDGGEIRIIIGSQIIREGLHFVAVRHQFIASMPTDIPSLIQVFGRVVRKNSHAALPQDQRDVKIRIFVSTRSDSTPSSELRKYVQKSHDYSIIQQVERAIHEYAIDNFIHSDKINTALLSASPTTTTVPTIDALPFDAMPRTPVPIKTSTFLAYGFGVREVELICSICRVLFDARPVWTYADLLIAIKSNLVHGVGFDPSIFSEGNVELALHRLQKDGLSQYKKLYKTDTYYISSTSTLDFRSYVYPIEASVKLKINITEFAKNTSSVRNWNIQIKEFSRIYILPGMIDAALVELANAFHVKLLEQIIMGNGGDITSDDTAVLDMYSRFNIAITVDDAHNAGVYRGVRDTDPSTIIGYVGLDSVKLLNTSTREWYYASHTDFNIDRRYAENDVVVGVTSPTTSVKGSVFDTVNNASLKIRPPIKSTGDVQVDIRTVIKGAVCASRTREDLIDTVKKLCKCAESLGVDIPSEFAVGVKHGTGKLCRSILIHLLALEMNSRSSDGDGIRWVYLFNERMPSHASLAGK
jgi:hypothetical protein